MSNSGKSRFNINQVAKTTPFDNSTGKGYSSGDVQTALEELRDHTIYDSRTQATTLNGTLTLTISDLNSQFITGTAAGYSVVLPAANTLSLTSYYQIFNTSSQNIIIKDGSGAALFTLGQSSIGEVWLQSNGSAAGTWVWFQTNISTLVGIISYEVISNTAFSTTSATDIVVTGFTVTPQAGTYAIWVSSTCTNTTNNSLSNLTIYKGATAVADSKRTFQSGSSNMTFQLATQGIVQVDGTTAIAGYVSTSTGTFVMNGRSLLLIRLGI
jgi:hypothetical protein